MDIKQTIKSMIALCASNMIYGMDDTHKKIKIEYCTLTQELVTPAAAELFCLCTDPFSFADPLQAIGKRKLRLFEPAPLPSVPLPGSEDDPLEVLWDLPDTKPTVVIIAGDRFRQTIPLQIDPLETRRWFDCEKNGRRKFAAVYYEHLIAPRVNFMPPNAPHKEPIIQIVCTTEISPSTKKELHRKQGGRVFKLFNLPPSESVIQGPLQSVYVVC